MEADRPAFTPPEQPPRPAWRKDLSRLLVLLLLAASIRAWLIRHTEVTARDGVGFMRYAWNLGSRPWPEVLRANPHPPLYPLTILAVSLPVRRWTALDDTAAMQLSAQLASALAGVLLVFPTYYLGKGLFGRGVGFWAAALFQCLPAGGRALSDALSEGVFLLLAAVALLLAYHALRNYSRFLFGLCGACAALAYLTRPEGILVIGAVGVVLAGMQLSRARRPWRQALSAGVSLTAAAVLVGSPYVVVIRHITNKTTPREVLRAEGPSRTPQGGTAAAPTKGPFTHVGACLATAPLAVYWSDIKASRTVRRLAWSLGALGEELLRGFLYLAGGAALLGLFLCRRQWQYQPGAWVLLSFCGLHALLLWRVAYVAGYVADRHTLLIVLCGLFWAVAGIRDLGARAAPVLAARCRRQGWERWSLGIAGIPVRAAGRRLARLSLALLALAALPKTLEPLHTNRAGYHAAGRWLAAHAAPGDVVVDPFAWAEFYAGRALRSGPPVEQPPPPPCCRYVVLGCSDNEHVRLPMIPFAESLARRGTEVYHWTSAGRTRRAEAVAVYRVP